MSHYHEFHIKFGIPIYIDMVGSQIFEIPDLKLGYARKYMKSLILIREV